MSKACPRCHADNRDAAQHCLSCGESFAAPWTPVHLCPAGRHPMDPGWQECPYCKTESVSSDGEGRRGGGTIIETPSRGTVPESGEPPRRPGPPADGRARKTRYERPPAERGKIGADIDRRRIVALLVTFSWVPEGEVFPLRVGRNYLGRDEECEVQVPHDLQLSRRHASIVYRGTGFWIDDEKSMSGTEVDGALIEERHRLSNYAQIRTGGTVWRFIVVDAPAETEGT